MTATADISTPTTAPSPLRVMAITASRDAVAFGVAMITLLGLYLLLQNPYWVPGGDSEVYTAIARNLAAGEGYTFNGQPVSLLPPGWPLLLAAAMKISPTFLFLKLLTMTCMLGSLAIAYWICRRFASPTLCALVIILSGTISHVYSLTFWLHSDALFCLLSMAALLLAFQISEGRAPFWKCAALVLLCGLAVTVRWAGLLTWLTVAAVLLRGEFLPRLEKRWYLAFTTGVVTLATFLIIRSALTVSLEAQKKIREFGGTGENTEQPIVKPTDVAGLYAWINPDSRGLAGYFGRAKNFGNWFSYLLWQPFRIGRTSAPVALIGLLVGWAVLAPLLTMMGKSILTRQWIWPALMAYSFALAMNWPHPNARYLVPIAPLLVLGVFLGMRTINEYFRSPRVLMTSKVLLGYFVTTMVLCNGALFTCDAWMARSANFYDDYEAGLNRDLIYAACWLNEHPPLDGQIGVCERYVNLGKARISRLGLRATNMLTDKAIVSIPKGFLDSDPRTNRKFLKWARNLGLKYYLYQPEVSPWRLFHFRVPWLQEIMADKPAINVGAGWRLYEIPPEGDEARRITVEPAPHWPTRVPGLEHPRRAPATTGPAK
jgi:hypothetical protein